MRTQVSATLVVRLKLWEREREKGRDGVVLRLCTKLTLSLPATFPNVFFLSLSLLFLPSILLSARTVYETFSLSPLLNADSSPKKQRELKRSLFANRKK